MPRRSATQVAGSRAETLAVAVELASVVGLEGLTIGGLADRLDMSKSGLVGRFGSKEQLQLATIDAALQIFNDDVVEPADAEPDALGRLRTLYDRFLEHIERRVFPGGCFFASAESELGMHEGPVKERVAAIQRSWTGHVEELVRAAQEEGSLVRDDDPAQLAFELDAYGMMGNVGFVLHDDPAYLRHARAAIERRLSTN